MALPQLVVTLTATVKPPRGSLDVLLPEMSSTLTASRVIDAEWDVALPNLAVESSVQTVSHQGQTIRWRFAEPSTGEIWELPINPNEANSPYVARNPVMAHGSAAGLNRVRLIDLAPSGPQDWTFGGVIRTKEHHDGLLRWANKNTVVLITTHQGRTFECVIKSFSPTDRRPTALVDWRMRYEMTCLVLKELS